MGKRPRRIGGATGRRCSGVGGCNGALRGAHDGLDAHVRLGLGVPVSHAPGSLQELVRLGDEGREGRLVGALVAAVAVGPRGVLAGELVFRSHSY